jgi:arylsulfatase I/J
MTSIAEKLRGAGYSTHAVGKWDAGMATFNHTPAGRGFHSWLGYFGTVLCFRQEFTLEDAI